MINVDSGAIKLPSTEPAPGEIIAGKYRVEGMVGKGGMGVVLAAQHLELRERVALKIVLAEFATDGPLVARFLREGRTAAKLKSEHVARVLDIGRLDDGRPYLVMDLLDGADLASFAEPSSLLSPREVVTYVVQACEAIAEAHALGIVHRDLKPANLFLVKRGDGSGSVKVLDFGIAKIASYDEKSMTRTRETMGSPLYMSPEQLRSSRDVDSRADIWSIGVILYELLSGTMPFEGETIGQLCTSVLVNEPAPLPASIPPELGAIVLRCLGKQPGQRFASVVDLAAALTPFAAPSAAHELSRMQAFRPSRQAFRTGESDPKIESVLAVESAPTLPVTPAWSAATSASASFPLRPRARSSRVPLVAAGLVTLLLGSGAVAAWRVLAHRSIGDAMASPIESARPTVAATTSSGSGATSIEPVASAPPIIVSAPSTVPDPTPSAAPRVTHASAHATLPTTPVHTPPASTQPVVTPAQTAAQAPAAAPTDFGDRRK